MSKPFPLGAAARPDEALIQSSNLSRKSMMAQTQDRPPTGPRLSGSNPGGHLFTPSGRYGKQPSVHLLILEQGPNPTTDYYLRPRLTTLDPPPTTIANIDAAPASVPIRPGTFVVIVRYINGRWVRHITRHQAFLSGCAYLMDDDLPDAWRSRQLPLRYRWKIQRLFLSQRAALARICDRVWVSNQYLADRYASSGALVLTPLPLVRRPDHPEPLTYFYHGTASHAPEHVWLLDIVRGVQAATQGLTFVTLGPAPLGRRYARVPRVLALHPLSWPGYLDALPAMRHDIGLAPLLETRFNQARSHTKFFDFTRLGAVGIYSEVPPYAQFIRHGVDGLLVANDPGAWHRAILDLAGCHERRHAMLDAARRRVDHLMAAGHSLPIRDAGPHPFCPGV